MTSSADASVAAREQPVAAGAPGSVEARLVETCVAAGVGLVVHLPDSVLLGFVRAIEADGRIPAVLCAREDEGVAIATGASLAGVVSLIAMEGSGLGYCGLILARARLQRSSFLLLASHTRTLGERFDFHAGARLAGAATLEGLGIPYEVPRTGDELVWLVEQVLVSVKAQREPMGILVPPPVMRARA